MPPGEQVSKWGEENDEEDEETGKVDRKAVIAESWLPQSLAKLLKERLRT